MRHLQHVRQLIGPAWDASIFACGRFFIFPPFMPLNRFVWFHHKKNDRSLECLLIWTAERTSFIVLRMRWLLSFTLSLSIYLSMHQYRCCFSKPSLCLLMFLPTSSAFRYHDSMTAKRQIIVYMHLSYMCLSVHFNAPVSVRCVCMSEMWNADGEMVLMLMLMMMMWWYETHQNMGNYV